MNVKDTLKTYLLTWPFSMINKLDVLIQLLMTYGNGMEWRNGELLPLLPEDGDRDSRSDKEAPPTTEDAVHNVIRSTFSRKIDPWSEEWLHDKVSLIFRLDERISDMTVATQEKYPYSFVRESAKVDRLHRILSPVCGFSAICDLPDDIKPDWLAAAKEMYEFINSHPELIADVDQDVFSKWMPRIKSRIEELEHKDFYNLKLFNRRYYMTVKQEMLYVDPGTAQVIDQALREPVLDKYETIVFTAKFDDGREMDIKCCDAEDEPAWTEAVLFDSNGSELACSEVGEDFFGEWEIEYDDVTYKADVRREKWLYRLEAASPDNGLWYNSNNEYVWGCRDCKGDAKNLPMGYDARYHIDGKNWFSSCSNKEDLLHWYSKEDAEWLLEHGFVFTRYLARDYHEFDKETVFLKETAAKREVIDFLTLFEEN